MDEIEEKKEQSQELPAEEEILPEDAAPSEEKEEYTPRPLGLRIFAWVLAILVIIGLALYYYHIFIGR